ncbi:MAG: hypothetical protein HQL53_04615 [Magnetococcales bacterium]|nr:hypothetical protein [Magnetococcales bacterium]
MHPSGPAIFCGKTMIRYLYMVVAISMVLLGGAYMYDEQKNRDRITPTAAPVAPMAQTPANPAAVQVWFQQQQAQNQQLEQQQQMLRQQRNQQQVQNQRPQQQVQQQLLQQQWRQQQLQQIQQYQQQFQQPGQTPQAGQFQRR